MPMPSDIKKLIYDGTDIGQRPMYDALGNVKYYKYNGLKDKQALYIAHYMIGIPQADRKTIMELLMMQCKPLYLVKITSLYQSSVIDLFRKNEYRIKTGSALVCDHLGVIH